MLLQSLRLYDRCAAAKVHEPAGTVLPSIRRPGSSSQPAIAAVARRAAALARRCSAPSSAVLHLLQSNNFQAPAAHDWLWLLKRRLHNGRMHWGVAATTDVPAALHCARVVLPAAAELRALGGGGWVQWRVCLPRQRGRVEYRALAGKPRRKGSARGQEYAVRCGRSTEQKRGAGPREGGMREGAARAGGAAPARQPLVEVTDACMWGGWAGLARARTSRWGVPPGWALPSPTAQNGGPGGPRGGRPRQGRRLLREHGTAHQSRKNCVTILDSALACWHVSSSRFESWKAKQMTCRQAAQAETGGREETRLNVRQAMGGEVEGAHERRLQRRSSGAPLRRGAAPAGLPPPAARPPTCCTRWMMSWLQMREASSSCSPSFCGISMMFST